MKYLRRYNESVNESVITEDDMRNIIGDILTELQDEQFSITFFKDNGYGEDDYKIHIGTKQNKDFYKWEEVKHAVGHIMNFAEDNGYFCSVTYYKPIRKPRPGKEPNAKDVMLQWAKRHTFTTSGYDKKPEDDDYVCVSSRSNGVVKGLDIIISLLGRR